MRSIPTRFFATAAIFALIGMLWGIQMSASHDHVMAPAHAHLNLIGFVLMAVFGTYYALTPEAAARSMARVHYWLATATVVILTPGIVFAINNQGEVLAQIGSILALVTMALFTVTILRHGVGVKAPGRRELPGETMQPIA